MDMPPALCVHPHPAPHHQNAEAIAATLKAMEFKIVTGGPIINATAAQVRAALHKVAHTNYNFMDAFVFFYSGIGQSPFHMCCTSLDRARASAAVVAALTA